VGISAESGDLCEKGHQLRPHILWFSEPVPMISKTYGITQQADILLIIGTSLNVYPAAGLVNYVSLDVPIYLIDYKDVAVNRKKVFHLSSV
jgi:NAD-dependent deacetylase